MATLRARPAPKRGAGPAAALLRAAGSGNTELAATLCGEEPGLLVSSVDREGCTAFVVAAKHGDADMLKMVITLTLCHASATLRVNLSECL